MENRCLKPISFDEFARLLAVSPRTVRRMIDRGHLPPIRVGAILTLSPRSLPEPLRREFRCGSAIPLLRLHDVAQRLGCSPDQVRNLAEDGSLAPIQVGSSQRWSEAMIQAYRDGGPRT